MKRKWGWICLAGITFSVCADVTIHVDVAAKAGGAGTKNAPCRTLEEARDTLRAWRTSGKIKAGEAAEIRIASGDYLLSNTLELQPGDSGFDGRPVIWRAADSGKVRLIGGVKVNPSLFRPISDKNTLARLPEEVRGKVFVADVSALLPGELPAWRKVFNGVYAAPLLFVNHKIMTLARWPNAEWTSFTKATDTGYDRKPDNHTDTTAKLLPEKPHPGAFLYDNPRVLRWNFQEDVWLNGFWTHDWDNQNVRAASYDATKKEIRLAAAVPYGVARGTWGRKDRRFFVFNLLEELDAPGEWYLDRAKKLLYFYPPSDSLSACGEIVLASLRRPMLSLAPGTRHLRFERLVFEYSYENALSMNSVTDVQVNGCTIANIAKGGICISGERNEIRSCDLYQLGTYGISVNGGDRKTLSNGNNLIENNDIHDYALFQRTYAAGINVNGCGQIIRNNAIHDAPHCAVLYSGNEHLFEYNNVYRVVMETGDAGAFYTGRDWTTQGVVLRYNYVHELGAGAAAEGNTMGFYFDDCDCGDSVIGNIFWKVSRGIMIGGGRDHPVRNNLFADCAIGISIDSRGMTWRHWNNTNDPSWCLDAKACALNYKQPPWSTRYPRLADIMNDCPREPLYNPLENNIFLDCTRSVLSLDKNVFSLMDKMTFSGNIAINTTGTNRIATVDKRIKGFTSLSGSQEDPIRPGFRDVAKGDFSLVPDAPIFRMIPDFQAFPIDKIGLQPDRYRK